MEEKVLITGGNGLVAQRLAFLLTQKGYQIFFLSRSESNKNTYKWDINQKYIDPNAFINTSHIIHLAGAGVADSRWTDSRKKEIYNSRIDSTKLLADYITKSNSNIKTFISASAVGYYGFGNNSEKVSETNKPGSDFLANVCIDWEKEAFEIANDKIRTVILRIGIVLSSKGAALGKLLPIFKLGFGSAIGSGKQIMPWIHIDDLCNMFINSIENQSYNGIYNAVAPNPVSNFEFSKTLAQILKRPFFIPNIPTFILKIIMGKMAIMITTGVNAESKKIENLGFKFKFNYLKEALNFHPKNIRDFLVPRSVPARNA